MTATLHELNENPIYRPPANWISPMPEELKIQICLAPYKKGVSQYKQKINQELRQKYPYIIKKLRCATKERHTVPDKNSRWYHIPIRMSKKGWLYYRQKCAFNDQARCFKDFYWYGTDGTCFGGGLYAGDMAFFADKKDFHEKGCRPDTFRRCIKLNFTENRMWIKHNGYNMEIVIDENKPSITGKYKYYDFTPMEEAKDKGLWRRDSKTNSPQHLNAVIDS